MTTTALQPSTQRLVSLGLAAVPEAALAAVFETASTSSPQAVITQPSVRSRIGEHRQRVSALQQLRAVYCTDAFWTMCKAFPNNTLRTGRLGAPQGYPDWFLYLLVAAAGVTNVATYRAAISWMHDPVQWEWLVNDIDQYVPGSWTRLAECVPSGRRASSASAPRTPARLTVVDGRARRKRRKARFIALPVTVLPPEYHHLAYWIKKTKGFKKINGRWEATGPGDPWHDIQNTILDLFRDGAVEQAQAMGLLDRNQDFQFKNPDRHQYVGFDGVVFGMTDKRSSTACQMHTTGASRRKVYGTKFTIGSTRVNGQYGSRVIVDFGHNGRDPQSAASNEADAIVAMAFGLRDRTRGGLKGIITDGVLRDAHITPLQRGWITVVSPPTAASNKGATQGRRMGPQRREKDHLRTIAVHHDHNGRPCEHPIYLSGGRALELSLDGKGNPVPVALEVVGYIQRGKKDLYHPDGPRFGLRREYLMVRVPCQLVGAFDVELPLFQTDSTSADPDYKWGEVARVFGLGTAAYAHIYGARNDTESRHTDLKARLKHLPPDVAGQQLRLLGAAMVSNAVAWHLHLQANGRPNIFDNTA